MILFYQKVPLSWHSNEFILNGLHNYQFRKVFYFNVVKSQRFIGEFLRRDLSQVLFNDKVASEKKTWFPTKRRGLLTASLLFCFNKPFEANLVTESARRPFRSSRSLYRKSLPSPVRRYVYKHPHRTCNHT